MSLVVPSYSILPDGLVSEFNHTTAITMTSWMYPRAATITPDPLAEATAGAHLDPRKKKKQYNLKAVWMKHPWTGSHICYNCWHKKNTAVNSDKFLCRSGPEHTLLCGEAPEIASVHTSHVTSTVTTTQLVEATTVAPLQERSSHQAVLFHHPWVSDVIVCGDSEWENKGQSDSEIRLQDIEAANKCKDDARQIDAVYQTTTLTSYTTTTTPFPASLVPTGSTKTFTVTSSPSSSTVAASTVTVYVTSTTIPVVQPTTYVPIIPIIPIIPGTLAPRSTSTTAGGPSTLYPSGWRTMTPGPTVIDGVTYTIPTATSTAISSNNVAATRPSLCLSTMAFLPRTAFPAIPSLPRSYFLGHHKAGLQKMKTLLSTIDLVIECRDYRVPLTSRNPLFETSLEGKERLIVYTKRDLGGPVRDADNEDVIAQWHHPTATMFVRNTSKETERARGRGSMAKLLDYLREHAQKRWKLVGHRLLVVGMPNVGKSTLVNSLRAQGIGKGKAAATGAQPGVTRKVGSGVKIVPSEDDVEDEIVKSKYKGVGGGVYLLDTPGVFIPYVPDAEAMMKLALCGSVKDTIIPPVLLADYLLYHINLISPALYNDYCTPTNDIVELLEAIAKKTGRLGKKGKADTEASALWMIQKWRTGYLGRFLLDEVDVEAFEKTKIEEEDMVPSMNQARKAEKERRRERGRARGEK
ncbi:hypothetical protein BDV95DRAFT_486998 [Massariosphaeria phaeospora]|uniref:G domain-containing protein n=1 Tax=Massariosphaeria phaeospora TaxID=100035 RepID=A0A7C8MA66_9PLEO|nr:hypothetical protein BDV95DRAFT_486998 [Massariosphaeria phaeospora]